MSQSTSDLAAFVGVLAFAGFLVLEILLPILAAFFGPKDL